MTGWSFSPQNLLHLFSTKKENPDKLRPFFDETLHSSLKNLPHNELRPLPVLLGDGRYVDLFKMYVMVKERGGFDSITKMGSWDSVAEQLGFDSRCGPPLKLVYVKYLSFLDAVVPGAEKNNGGEELEGKKGMERRDVIYIDSDGDENFGDHGGDSVMSEEGSLLSSNLKRKYEDGLMDVLEWLKRVALDPCDPGRGAQDCEGNKWCLVNECLSRALVARKAMMLSRPGAPSSSDSSGQKRQKMHPSMYNDPCSEAATDQEKVRSSQRLLSLHGRHPRTCSIATIRTRPSPMKSSSFSKSGSSDLLQKNNPPRIRIPIGSAFQARVPAWDSEIAKAAASEPSKWIGEKIWTPSSDSSLWGKMDEIGKGRPDSCNCNFPGSIGCFKRHIAEARLYLRHELGSNFYVWKFDEMGEDVAVAWSHDEEQRFKAIVKSNPPSMGRNFWDEIYSTFPSKSKRILASYYFNVFVLRRRTFQNRMTPKDVDSDDDNADFGPVSENLVAGGYSALSTVKDAFCAKNRECDDSFELHDIDQQSGNFR